MDQAVNAVLDFDKGTEVGEVADAPLDHRAGRVTIRQVLPRVLLQLLHAERDAAVVRVHAQDDGVDLVAGVDHLRRVLHALGPGHLGHVDQAFDALLELHKGAVVSHRKYPPANARAHRIALDRIKPGVRGQLLEAERNPLLVLVELQHLDLDFIGDVDQVARMGQAPPAHVGDVQQAVQAAHVDERAVVGQVLDHAGQDRAFFQVLERFAALDSLLFFEQFLAGNHHVAALLIQLDDADLDLRPNIGVQVADRANLQLRAGQKCLDTHVDGHAALDAT